MDLDEFYDLVYKIGGPILIILAPILLIGFFIAPAGKSTTLWDYIGVTLFIIFGFALGIFACRKAYGWSSFLDKFFKK